MRIFLSNKGAKSIISNTMANIISGSEKGSEGMLVKNVMFDVSGFKP
jgi:hypothetical protein